MGLGMRKIKGSPERMAELVVKSHSGCTKASTTKPGAIKRLGFVALTLLNLAVTIGKHRSQ